MGNNYKGEDFQSLRQSEKKIAHGGHVFNRLCKLEDLTNIICTKLQIILTCTFHNVSNKKQELSIAAMFFPDQEKNKAYL
jgi:hypothetical protein